LDILTETFVEMVGRLKKPGAEILESLTPEKCDMLHMASGVAGEAAGEILDNVKKHVFYNKPLDRENLIEELGDVLFYIEGLMQNVGVTRKEVEIRNQAKLSTGKNARYAQGYSDKAAQERADKAV
jgi:NTP pyrophosphatase (non-canonical NTP hydrolase)